MATQAVISLVVDESGAVAGVNRFDARAKAAFAGTAAEAKIAGEQITIVGAAGTKAGAAVEAGFQKANGSMLSNIESTRLMSESLGVHMPRAMTKLIAQTQAFQAISSVAFGGFAVLAGGEILYSLGKRLYEAFSKGGDGAREQASAIVDINTEIKRTNDSLDVQIAKVQEARAKLEGKPTDGIHLAILEDIEAADTLSAKLQGVLANFQTKVIANMGGSSWTNWLTGSANTNYEQTMVGEHARHLGEASGTEEVSKENASFTKSLQIRMAELLKMQANAPNKDVGTNDYSNEIKAVQAAIDLTKKQQGEVQKTIDLKKGQAALDADHDKKEHGKEQADKSVQYAAEVRDAWQKSALARVDGEAKAYKEMLFQMEDYVQKAKAAGTPQATITQVTGAMQDTYYSERAQREQAAADKSKETADKTNAEILGKLKSYSDSERQLRDQLNESTLTGYARLDAGRARRDHDALSRYQEVIAGMKATDQSYMDATKTYNLERQDIDDETEKKKRDLHQSNMDATASMEEQAGSVHSASHQKGLMGVFAQEQQQTSRIDAEYQKRVRDAQAMEDGTADAHADAVARMNAAGDLRDAQMADEQNAMRDRLASTLESAFKDPMGSIKDAMQREMMEIVANWIMQLTIFKQFQSSILGGHAAPGAAGIPGVAGAASGGGIFGSLFHGSSAHSVGSPSSGSGGGGGVYGGSGGVGASEYSSVSSGVYGGSSDGSGIGSTISSAATDIPGVMKNVSAARAQDRARAGSISTPGTESTVSFDENGNATTNATIGGTQQLHDMPGVPSVPKGSAAATGVGDAATVGFAGYEGYGSTKDDFKSGSAGGTMKGMLGDAMAGMAIGSLFGPEGALIGAGIGAAVGAVAGITGAIMGEGGRLAARDYYKKTIFPQIEMDRNGYQGGDFQTAISDVNKQASDGLTYMRSKWGGSAADWVNQNYLRKEQILAVGEIGARAKGGSYAVSMSAKQFHSGGTIDGFGDLATSPNEGFIHAMLGEAVINPQAASTHAPAISAMQSGASPAEMASMYRGADGSGSSGGDTHHHYNINAIDAKGFDSFLRNGGARQIVKHVNNFASQYAGDGISG